MNLYRARPGDGVAWITGASSGIGRELAIAMARAGYVVAASARSGDKLESLAAEASGLSGRIVAYPCDVTDRAAVSETVQRVEDELGAITLAVFNAGNYFPVRGDRIDASAYLDTYAINVFGVIYGLEAVSPRMIARRAGHIAVVGSVSGYGGLPMASAYGASKAAVINMMESLKFDLEPRGVRVQMINPGFVETPLTDKNDFDMPALVPVDKAVDRIMDGLRSGGFEITFPRRLSWALKLLQFLPYPLYFALVGRATGADKRAKQAVSSRKEA